MPAMAPSTTSSNAKITATFDVASLFVADKEARTGAAQALASQSKNEGASFFGDIGLPEAIVKVSHPKDEGLVDGC
jgi:elongation factor 3